MNRIEEIKERNERHKELKERGRRPVGDPMVISNHELNEAMFEIKHINDKTPEDIQYLLSRLEIAEKALSEINSIKVTEYGTIIYSDILRIMETSDQALQQIRS